MHPATTRSEFLRLRVQGLSLARIGRRLGVSKPTLIAWSRQAQPEIDSRIVQDRQRLKLELTASTGQQLADLTRKLTALKQELFSRALRDIPTRHLETLAGELRQRIEHLEPIKSGTPLVAPKPSEGRLVVQQPSAAVSLAPSDGERGGERGSFPIENQNSEVKNESEPIRT